jgi:hypothetical protein
MFANEASGHLHRFWRVMIRLGCFDPAPPAELMEKLQAGETAGKYDLAVVSAFTLPTPNSGAWSGLQGVKKLLGPKGFRLYHQQEQIRLAGILSTLPLDSVVLSFQVDASRLMISAMDHGSDPSVKLQQLPPTRLMYSQKMSAQLSAALFD